MRELKDVFIVELITSVCTFFNVSGDGVMSKSRMRNLFLARMTITYCLLYLGYSHSSIGLMIGRDHSSIAHYKRLFEYDKLWKDTVYELTVYMGKRGIIIPGYVMWSQHLWDIGKTKNKLILEKR